MSLTFLVFLVTLFGFSMSINPSTPLDFWNCKEREKRGGEHVHELWYSSMSASSYAIVSAEHNIGYSNSFQKINVMWCVHSRVKYTSYQVESIFTRVFITIQCSSMNKQVLECLFITCQKQKVWTNTECWYRNRLGSYSPVPSPSPNKPGNKAKEVAVWIGKSLASGLGTRPENLACC